MLFPQKFPVFLASRKWWLPPRGCVNSGCRDIISVMGELGAAAICCDLSNSVEPPWCPVTCCGFRWGVRAASAGTGSKREPPWMKLWLPLEGCFVQRTSCGVGGAEFQLVAWLTRTLTRVSHFPGVSQNMSWPAWWDFCPLAELFVSASYTVVQTLQQKQS